MRKALITLFCLIPTLTQGEVSGVYEMQGGKTMTLHYRDADHLRMDLGTGEFMLVQGDKAWMVNKRGGQWTAVDMSSMGKMMQQMGFQGGQQQAQDYQQRDPSDYSFNNTGRTETVAGYEGRVYEVVGPDGKRTEMVLSDHEDIRTLTRGWVHFSGKMMSNMGVATDDSLDALLNHSDFGKLGGTLRVEDGMRLKSVSREGRGDDFYSLPPGTQVQDMSGMGGIMQQQSGRAPAGGQSGNGESGAQEFMNEREQKARDKVERDLERETDKKIEKGVNKLMDGLFGG